MTCPINKVYLENENELIFNYIVSDFKEQTRLLGMERCCNKKNITKKNFDLNTLEI